MRPLRWVRIEDALRVRRNMSSLQLSYNVLLTLCVIRFQRRHAFAPQCQRAVAGLAPVPPSLLRAAKKPPAGRGGSGGCG